MVSCGIASREPDESAVATDRFWWVNALERRLSARLLVKRTNNYNASHHVVAIAERDFSAPLSALSLKGPRIPATAPILTTINANRFLHIDHRSLTSQLPGQIAVPVPASASTRRSV